MKTVGLILGMVLINVMSYGQYTMNTTSTPYQPLTSPISINNNTLWNDGSSFPVYFNFNFNIYGQIYTALNVQAGGRISFPGLGYKQLTVYHSPFSGLLLKDKGDTNSASPIGYEISGTTGQQVLKIEWKNAGFVNNFDTADYVDFQIWLFESDNHIEIHFGSNHSSPGTYGYPASTSDPNPGPSIKFTFNTCSDVLCVIDVADLPSYGFYDLCSPTYTFIDGTPSSGITYNFNPSSSSVGISKINKDGISIAPNPFSNAVTIAYELNKSAALKLCVTNVYGVTIAELFNDNLPQGKHSLHCTMPSHVASGLYILNFIDDTGNVIREKINYIKQ